MKKNVLHVISSLSPGGAETMLMNIYRNIDRNKLNFDFLVFGHPDGFYYDEIKKLGGNVYAIPPIRESGVLCYIYNLIRFFKNTGPYNAVHSHIDYLSVFVMFAAFCSNIKIRIAHSHNSGTYSHRGALNTFLIQFVRCIINLFSTDLVACSNNAASFMFGKNSLKKVKIINNAINLDKYCFELNTKSKMEIKSQLGIQVDAKIIGNIARFVEQKNHKRIIEIFNMVVKENPIYHLVLIGEGELIDNIKEQVSQLKIEKNVHFLGLRSDINVIIKSFDLFLLPSHFEGFPVTLVEAQASGVPCIISDVITRDIDFELGLIEFISLSQSNEVWKQKILNINSIENKNIDLYKKIITKNGFDINDNIQYLYSIYK